MKRQLTLLLSIALLAVPAMLAQNQDGVQVLRYDGLMSPSHESPPIEGVDVSGEAVVEISVMREGGMIKSAMVDFRVDWSAGEAVEFRAMHIHRGAAGVNGPVVVSSGLSALPASTGGVIFRQAKVMDATLIEEIMANPAGFYVNVHSVSHPGGLIRAQLQPDISQQLKMLQSELQKQINDVDNTMRQGFHFPPKR